MYRTDKDSKREIGGLDVKLKKYCSGKGFIYIDINNVNESCLSISKLRPVHLNKKDFILFS